MIYAYPYATVTRVHDGDTFWVDIDLGLRLHTEQKVRVRGVNAAELGDPDPEKKRKADEARDWLTVKLPAGTPVQLVAHAWTYDRLECDVMLKDGSNLAQDILDADMAVRAHR